MSKAIAIFNPTSKEYKRLKSAAILIEAETEKTCNVECIYFDVGQNWKWTTISIESNFKSFPMVQALNPKQQEDIVFGDFETYCKTVHEVIQHNS